MDEPEDRPKLKLVTGLPQMDGGLPETPDVRVSPDSNPDHDIKRRVVADYVRNKAPQEHEKVNKLQLSTGLPRDAVELKTPEVEAEARRRKLQEGYKTAPANAELMQDPAFAGVAQGGEEANIQKEKQIADDAAQKAMQDYLDDTNFLAALAYGTVMDAPKAFKGFWDATKLTFKEVIPNSYAMQWLEDYAAIPQNMEAQYAMATALGTEETAAINKEITEGANKERPELKAKNDALMKRLEEYAPDPNLHYGARMLRMAGDSTALTAPGLAALITTKNPVPMMANMFATTQTMSYANAISKGATPWEARRIANIDAIIELGTEYLPAQLLSKIPGFDAAEGEVSQAITKYMLSEVAGEQVATLTQAYNEYLHGLNEQWNNATTEERMKMQIEQQVATFWVTLLQSGGQSGAAYIPNLLIRKNHEKKFKAMTEHQRLNSLVAGGKENATRGVSPAQYKRLIKRTLENTETDGEALITYDEAQKFLDSVEPGAEMDDPFIAKIKDELTLKASTKADVAVDLADYAAYGPSHASFESLAIHTKVDPEGMTMNDLGNALVDSIIEQNINKLEEDRIIEGKLKDTYTKLVADLTAKGRLDPEVARMSALVVPAMIKSIAERNKMDVQSVFNTLPFQVLGMDETAPDGVELDQVVPFGKKKLEALDADMEEKLKLAKLLADEKKQTQYFMRGLREGVRNEEDPGKGEIDTEDDEQMLGRLFELLQTDGGFNKNVDLYYTPGANGQGNIIQRGNSKKTPKQLLEQVRALQEREKAVDAELADVQSKIEAIKAERSRMEGRVTLGQDKDTQLAVAETQIESAKASFTADTRMAVLQAANTYGGKRAAGMIGAKEMLQNSFDAIKDLIYRSENGGAPTNFGPNNEPTIVISVDPDTRTITVSDNGIGMSADTIANYFLRLAGSKKLNPRSSGGFGKAKMAFLINSKSIEIDTVHDGVRSKLTTNPEQILRSMSNLEEDKIEIEQYATTEPNGTVMKLTLDENYIDPDSGREHSVDFPATHLVTAMVEESPLFRDFVVTVNGIPARVGKNFRKDNWTVAMVVDFAWGQARVMVGKEPAQYYWDQTAHVLSDGVIQFSAEISSLSVKIPFEFYIDVISNVKPSSSEYPFQEDRRNFSVSGERDFRVLTRYLQALYQNHQLSEGAKGFGAIYYVSDDLQVSDLVELKPENIDNPDILKLRPDPSDKIEIHDGKMIVNGVEKPPITEDDLKAMNVDISNFTITQDKVNPNEVMVHENLWYPGSGVTITEAMVTEFGSRANEYLHGVGKIMQRVRDLAVTMNIQPLLGERTANRQTMLLEEVAVGVSFDKQYLGVHTPLPFRGMFINPGITRMEQLTDNLPVPFTGKLRAPLVAQFMLGTMQHEIAHFDQMSHGVAFEQVMQTLNAFMNISPLYHQIEKDFASFMEKNYDIYEWLAAEYQNPALTNRGERLQGEDEIVSRDNRQSGRDERSSDPAEYTQPMAEGSEEGTGVRTPTQDDLFLSSRTEEERPLEVTLPLGVPKKIGAQKDLFERTRDEQETADIRTTGQRGDAVESRTATPTGRPAPQIDRDPDWEDWDGPEATALQPQPVQREVAPRRDNIFPKVKKILGHNLEGGAEVGMQRKHLSDTQVAARNKAIADKLMPDTETNRTRFSEGFTGAVLNRGPYQNPAKVLGWKAGMEYVNTAEGKAFAAKIRDGQDAADAKVAEWVEAAREVGRTQDNSNRIILSLFDYTGQWSQPWVDAGYDVIQFDIKLGNNLADPEYLQMIVDRLEEAVSEGSVIEGILSAPPCDTFTKTSSLHWDRHDAQSTEEVKKMFGSWAALNHKSPTDAAIALLDSVVGLVDQLNPRFYVMENPAGRIGGKTGLTILPDAAMAFDPYNFGDPYTKTTQLWGEFNGQLPTAFVFPYEGSAIHNMWGGSKESKALRSVTPKGFSYAFFMANHQDGPARLASLSVQEAEANALMNSPEIRLWENISDKVYRTFGNDSFAWAMDADVMDHYGYPEQTDLNILLTHVAMMDDYGNELMAAWRDVQKSSSKATVERLEKMQSDVQQLVYDWLTPVETMRFYEYVTTTANVTAAQVAQATGIKGSAAIQDLLNRMRGEGMLIDDGAVLETEEVEFEEEYEAEDEIETSPEMAKLAREQAAKIRDFIDETHSKKEAERKVYDFVETFPAGREEEARADFAEFNKLAADLALVTYQIQNKIDPVTGESYLNLPVGKDYGQGSANIKIEGTQVQAIARLKGKRHGIAGRLKSYIDKMEQKYGGDVAEQMTHLLILKYSEKSDPSVAVFGSGLEEDLAKGRRWDTVVATVSQMVGRNVEMRRAAGLPDEPELNDKGIVMDQPEIQVIFEHGVVYAQLGAALDYVSGKDSYGKLVGLKPLAPGWIDRYSLGQYEGRLQATMSDTNPMKIKQMTRNEYKLHVPPTMVNKALSATKFQKFYDWLQKSEVDTAKYGSNSKVKTITNAQGEEVRAWVTPETTTRRGGMDFGGEAILDEKLGLTAREFWENVHNGNMEHVRSIAKPSAKREAMVKGGRVLFKPEEGSEPKPLPKQETLFQSGKVFTQTMAEYKLDPIVTAAVKSTLSNAVNLTSDKLRKGSGKQIKDVAKFIKGARMSGTKEDMIDSIIEKVNAYNQIKAHNNSKTLDGLSAKFIDNLLKAAGLSTFGNKADKVARAVDHIRVFELHLAQKVAEQGYVKRMYESLRAGNIETPEQWRDFQRALGNQRPEPQPTQEERDTFAGKKGAEKQLTLFQSKQVDMFADEPGDTGEQTPNPRIDLPHTEVTKRSPVLQDALAMMASGQMSMDQYNELVAQEKPFSPYLEVPEPASQEAMGKALKSNQKSKLGAPQSLKAGAAVSLRLDIPAYKDHGQWVVTVHEKSGGSTAGTVVGYDSFGSVTGADFAAPQEKAMDIAKGGAKSPIARIEGKWQPMTEAEAVKRAEDAINDPAWIQVGYDPERHGYFWDRATGEPVVAAAEVIQVAGLVLARNPEYAPKGDFLYQDEKRGMITIDREARRAFIRMLAARDKSTFLHESAHWYLEVLRVLEVNGNVAPEMRKQIDSILKFLEVKSLSEVEDHHHEKFAETFEIYLREGKAPSVGLRRAFQAFADWLTKIYKAVQGGKLDAETRAIFDRMLATDEQIAIVNLESHYTATIDAAKAAGWEDKDLLEFIEKMTYGDDDAREKLRVKLLKQFERKTKKWWKDELAREYEIAQGHLANMPVYQAIAALRDSPKAEKLDRNVVFKLMRWGKPPKEVEPEHAVAFLAKQGGINREAADKEGIDEKNWLNVLEKGVKYKRVLDPDSKSGKKRVAVGYGLISVRNPLNYPMSRAPGMPPLFVEKGGMTFDEAAERLMDAGFIDGVRYGQVEFRGGDRRVIYSPDDTMEILQEWFAGRPVLLPKDEEAQANLRLNAEYAEEQGIEYSPMPKSFYGMTADKGGLNPEIVARQYGYESAVEMINDIVKAKPLATAAMEMADQAMTDRHGDILNDGSLALEALAAAHNVQRGRAILKGIMAMNRQLNKAAIHADIEKASARDQIAALKLSDIKLKQLRKAEITAAQEYAVLLKEGKTEEAYEANLRFYRAFLLYQEAERALKKVARFKRRFSQYEKTKYGRRKLDPEFTAELKRLAGSLVFNRKNLKERDDAIKARAEVGRFIAKYNKDPGSLRYILGAVKDEQGNDVVSAILGDADTPSKKEWSEMTVGEITEISEIANSIYAVGIADTKAERDAFNLKMQNMGGGIIKNKIPGAGDPGWTPPAHPIYNGWTAFREMAAGHRKLESLIRAADGLDDSGPLWKEIFLPLLESTKVDMILHRDFYHAAQDLFKDNAGIFHFLHDVQVFQLESGKTVRLSLNERMSIAVNWGNKGNREALLNMDRLKLTEHDIGRILNSLDNSQWDVVEKIYDLVSSQKQAIGELEMRMSGVEPTWVEAEPFVLESGRVIKGGYFPLVSDRRLDYFGRDTEMANRAAQQGAGTTHAFTLHGFTKARKGFGGHTVELDMGAFFRHMDRVFHDLAFRESVAHASRVLNNPHMRKALIETLGDEKYRAMINRVKEIGGGMIAPQELRWLEKIMRWARVGITLGSLGFSAKTFVSQSFGINTAIAELGAKTMKLGSVDYFKNTEENFKFIMDHSIMMKERMQYMNRDATAVMRQLKGITKLEQIQEMSFVPLLWGDFMVSVPVWWSAYTKGLNNVADPNNKNFLTEQDALDYADRIVYRTQQSGLLIDLSGVETQNELVRVMTMMYSAFSAIHQITQEQVEKYQLGKQTGMQLAAKLFAIFVNTAIMDWLWFGDDYDEEKDSPVNNPLTRSLLATVAAPYVGLRDLSFFVTTGRMGETPLSTLLKTGPELIKQISQFELDQGLLRAFNKTMSVMLHVPAMSGQINRTLNYLIDLSQGEIENPSVFDAILTGRDGTATSDKSGSERDIYRRPERSSRRVTYERPDR